MEIYVVIEDIDDYPECGGGEYPDAVFLNRSNAEKYINRKMKERINASYIYYIQTWKTSDSEEENN
jgi:hypothetical protein